jgi:hypothetical protein
MVLQLYEFLFFVKLGKSYISINHLSKNSSRETQDVDIEFPHTLFQLHITIFVH